MDSRFEAAGLNEAIQVGTIVARSDGFGLVTDSRNFAVAGSCEDLRPWEQRRVVVSGLVSEPDLIEIQSIHEMLSEDEVVECARFVIGKYGRLASEHVRNRLERAESKGSPQELAIWQAIGRHFVS